MSLLKKNFTFIDLFAGIGGFHYAMKKYSSKAECVFASEVNKNAIKVYKQNHQINSDFNIKDVKGDMIPDFDVVCAGFPCQSFSKAGNQKGFKDERGVLFNEIERLIIEKISKGSKPKILILENVKNLATHDKSRTWNIIKQKLTDLGFNVIDKPKILSPNHFGIPQLRDRAIILAVDSSIYNGPIDLTIKTSKDETKIDTILEKLNKEDMEKYSISDNESRILNAWDDFIKRVKVKTIGFPIWSDYFYNGGPIDDFPEWKKEIVYKNRQFYLEHKDVIDSWYMEYNIKSFMPTYRKFEWQAGTDINSVFEGIVQFRPSGIRVKRPTSAPTLVAIKHIPIIGKEKRYLTPKEAQKLQSFPDDFDSSQVGHDIYRLLGNAVNVEVIYQVFKQFIDYLDEKIGDNK